MTQPRGFGAQGWDRLRPSPETAAQGCLKTGRFLYSIACCAALLALAVSAGSCASRAQASQPIAFSHRVHVAKKLSCTFCHSGAEKYRQATIPSVTLCMSCHTVVKTDSPEIIKVRQYLDRREEIPWRRVYTIPSTAFVFFNHHRHAAAGVKCVTCHGDVGARDVLTQGESFQMGFCVSCHREDKDQFRPAALADDCATCHR